MKSQHSDVRTPDIPADVREWMDMYRSGDATTVEERAVVAYLDSLPQWEHVTKWSGGDFILGEALGTVTTARRWNRAGGVGALVGIHSHFYRLKESRP